MVEWILQKTFPHFLWFIVFFLLLLFLFCCCKERSMHFCLTSKYIWSRNVYEIKYSTRVCREVSRRLRSSFIEIVSIFGSSVGFHMHVPVCKLRDVSMILLSKKMWLCVITAKVSLFVLNRKYFSENKSVVEFKVFSITSFVFSPDVLKTLSSPATDLG